MADRQVKRSGKNEDGDIMSLCGGWGSVSKVQAIKDIEAKTNRYYVAEASPSVWVVVRGQGSGKYLTTEADGRSRNNLDNLPNC
jgi:hypothetical protein